MAFSTRTCVIVLSATAVLVLSVIGLSEIRALWGTPGEHEDHRERIMKEERLRSLGGTLELSANEERANAIIMDLKHKEIDEGFVNLTSFNPSQHFFVRKQHIEYSPIFKIIRAMPKGALLHAHDTALIGGDFLINITYMENLYICTNAAGIISLQFFRTPPSNPQCPWSLMKDVRETSGDVEQFDNRLRDLFTLEVDNPRELFKDINEVWSTFSLVFALVTPMLTYRPVWEHYFYEALKEFYKDNIMYMEVRSTFPDLYDLDGNIYDPLECMRAYKAANDRFIEDYPDAMGSRIIYAPLRRVPNEEVKKYVDIARAAKAEFGDFLAGFDLVGQEDLGRPLHDFIEELIPLTGEMDVFYHSGETNWFGLSTDYNMIDAILLGAKRLGHAYALLKHPVLVDMVKEKDIAIEINPLSNQILMLVEDMRNHPGSIMIAENFPVIISSDDPGLWGGLPVSHDFYMAFMGMASRNFDIRLLKQLALNSIKYSEMRSEQKVQAYAKFNAQWNCFVQDVINLEL